jgi:hypothetical protein
MRPAPVATTNRKPLRLAIGVALLTATVSGIVVGCAPKSGQVAPSLSPSSSESQTPVPSAAVPVEFLCAVTYDNRPGESYISKQDETSGRVRVDSNKGYGDGYAMREVKCQQNQSAPSAQPRNYTCSAKNLGTTEKIDIEFPYTENHGSLRNLYVSITQTSGNLGTWDALFSTDGESSLWTTPVLRDIAVGTSPLIIILNPGIRTPDTDRFEAEFYHQTYPVKCR